MTLIQKYLILGIAGLLVLASSFLFGRCTAPKPESSTDTKSKSKTTTTETKVPVPQVPTEVEGEAVIKWRDKIVEVPKYILYEVEKEIDTNVWSKKQLVSVIDANKDCCKPYTASKSLITKSNDTVGFEFNHPEKTYKFWMKPHQEFMIIRDNNTETTTTTTTTLWNKFVFGIYAGFGGNSDPAMANWRLGWSAGLGVCYRITL